MANDREDNRDEEDGDKRRFRVVDRRRFDADGGARSDTDARPEPSPSPDPIPVPPAGDQGGEGIDFLSFAMSLATNAMAALGALPPEQSRGMPQDPRIAKEYIDILGMLERKTRGNLTPQEASTLSQVLTELRARFLKTTR